MLPLKVKWTWDMVQNTNLEIRDARYRFDRVYIRPSGSRDMRASRFGLVGRERVEASQMFPSDHWGIRLDFKLPQRLSTRGQNENNELVKP